LGFDHIYERAADRGRRPPLADPGSGPDFILLATILYGLGCSFSWRHRTFTISALLKTAEPMPPR